MRTEINLTQADISQAITDYLAKQRNMEVRGSKLVYNLEIDDKTYQDVSNVTAVVIHDQEEINRIALEQSRAYQDHFTSRYRVSSSD